MARSGYECHHNLIVNTGFLCLCKALLPKGRWLLDMVNINDIQSVQHCIGIVSPLLLFLPLLLLRRHETRLKHYAR